MVRDYFDTLETETTLSHSPAERFLEPPPATSAEVVYNKKSFLSLREEWNTLVESSQTGIYQTLRPAPSKILLDTMRGWTRLRSGMFMRGGWSGVCAGRLGSGADSIVGPRVQAGGRNCNNPRRRGNTSGCSLGLPGSGSTKWI